MALRGHKRNLLRRQERTRVAKPPGSLLRLTGSYTCFRPRSRFPFSIRALSYFPRSFSSRFCLAPVDPFQ